MYETYKYGVVNTAGQAFYRTFERQTYQTLAATYGYWAFPLVPLRFLGGLLAASLYVFRTWFKTLFSLDTAQNRTPKFVLSWVATIGMGLLAGFGWGIIANIADALSVKIAMNIGTISSAVAGALFTAALATVVVAFVYMAAKSLAYWWEHQTAQVSPSSETSTRKLSSSGKRLTKELLPLVKSNENLNDLSKTSHGLETLYQTIQTALKNNDDSALIQMGIPSSRIDGKKVIPVTTIAQEYASTIKTLQNRLADFLKYLKRTDDGQIFLFGSNVSTFEALKKDFESFENSLTHILKQDKNLNPLKNYVLTNQWGTDYLVKEAPVVKQESASRLPVSTSPINSSGSTSPKSNTHSGRAKRRPSAIHTNIINGDALGKKSNANTPRTPRNYVNLDDSTYQENLLKSLTGEDTSITQKLGLTKQASVTLIRNDVNGTYQATFDTSSDEDKKDGNSSDGDDEKSSNPDNDNNINNIEGSPKLLTVQAPIISNVGKSQSLEFNNNNNDVVQLPRRGSTGNLKMSRYN